jgi:hypothetical protein
MEFLRINNRKNFLITEVPVLHPDSIAYTKYWKTHKKRCIEGFWGKDTAEVNIRPDDDMPEDIQQSVGNWRFMPGNLYFYVNYGTILHQEENGPKSAPKKKIKPLLRDIEWEFLYNYLEARGFSGFDGDDNVTCNRDIDRYNKGIIEFEEISKECFNSKGDFKEFVPAREYLRKLHDRPLGTPLYNNEARNLFVLGSRGFGKSFIVGVAILLYEIIFDGAKYYNEESIKNPYKVEVFVGAAIAAKSADLLSKTKEAMLNLPGAFGEGTKKYTPSPFYKQMSGTLAPNNMKNAWRHEYEKKEGGTWVTKGTGSNIKHGVYTIENPEAAAGTRPGVMAIEEVGLMGNVLTVTGSNTACQMEGTWKFGTAIYIGTGGNVDKIQESEIIFRDPSGFDFLEFDDIWEGTGKIGWFVPSYYALNQYKDENGNTNLEKAKAFRERVRAEKKKSKDPSALSLEMMNYPIIPSEMFLNAKGALFPQATLKSHLGDITSKPHKYANAHYYVDLEFSDTGEIKIIHKDRSTLETKFPVTDNKNKPGVIEIFEMPKKDNNGTVFKGRYIQATDTYDDDESVTNSLGSTMVLDLWTDRIVCEYTGRRSTKEFYEIVRKIGIFYNSSNNYENNKKGLYAYFETKKSLNLLCDTPEILKDVEDITISKIGNKRKGTTASKAVNAFGLRLILDYLMESAYGKEDEEIIKLQTLRSEGLIRELMTYNGNGNYDRISCMIMLMISREDKLKFLNRAQKERVEVIEEDPFFSRTYVDNSSFSRF